MSTLVRYFLDAILSKTLTATATGSDCVGGERALPRHLLRRRQILQERHDDRDVIPAHPRHRLAPEPLSAHPGLLHRIFNHLHALLVTHDVPQPVTRHYDVLIPTA